MNTVTERETMNWKTGNKLRKLKIGNAFNHFNVRYYLYVFI